MKHTPGPWTLSACTNGGLIVQRGQHHTQIVPVEDARLIAAAPALLEACKQALKAVGMVYDSDEDNSINPSMQMIGEAMDVLNAAIKKAEGDE